jgi:hypothetical protein
MTTTIDSRRTISESMPTPVPSAGTQFAERHTSADIQPERTLGANVLEGGASLRPQPIDGPPLPSGALSLAADILDDLENVRKANGNRLGALERDGWPTDHPDVIVLAHLMDALGETEKEAVKHLERVMKKHPLGPWMAGRKGVGLKQGARLLAAIGDPYWRSIEPIGPRTVSALWAYCGMHVLDGAAARRRKGERANWSTNAKTRTWLIIGSCIKTLRAPCTGELHADECACSPYRVAYDARKRYTIVNRPDWTDGHRHNDAQRVAGKALLRDLWLAARDLHHPPPTPSTDN